MFCVLFSPNCLTMLDTDDIDVWQSKSGTVFLERNETLQSLYDLLGCAAIGAIRFDPRQKVITLIIRDNAV